jgi:hypothetical protein
MCERTSDQDDGDGGAPKGLLEKLVVNALSKGSRGGCVNRRVSYQRRKGGRCGGGPGSGRSGRAQLAKVAWTS